MVQFPGKGCRGAKMIPDEIDVKTLNHKYGQLEYVILSNAVYIRSIEVHPDQRRQGIGTLLLRRLETIARDQKKPYITADLCTDDSKYDCDGNKLFLEKNGFLYNSKTNDFNLLYLKEVPPN
jgi:GNAT superfamily N-acetyltransferase